MTNTADYTNLIDTNRIRDSIRRLFDGKATTILSELFQNSQRAGATKVRITTTANQITYADDGTGILGVEGFYRLVCLGASSYENPEIESNQAPMGIGLHSLLACAQIDAVTISSNGLQLTIDTKRWWHDAAYYQSWAARLQRIENITGFVVIVDCHPDLVTAISEALPMTGKQLHNYWRTQIHNYPAWGYQDLLQIFLDDRPVYTGLPLNFTYISGLTSFKLAAATDCQIFDSAGFYWDNLQLVNWYGQLIPLQLPRCDFGVLLTVRDSRPVNPMSPTRGGIIEDELMQQLRSLLEDAIFAQLCNPNTRHCNVNNIEALYKLNPERAGDSCPFFVAGRLMPYRAPEWESLSSRYVDQEIVVVGRYEHPPLLVLPQLEIKWRENETTQLCVGDDPTPTTTPIGQYRPRYYGLCSLIPSVFAATHRRLHVLRTGNPARLKTAIHTLVWRPGAKQYAADAIGYLHWFYQRGEWCLESDSQPQKWFPVTSDIFVYENTCGCCPTETDWLIGCESPVQAWSAFYQAAFDSDRDEADANEYEDNAQAITRVLRGNEVSCQLKYQELIDYASRQTGKPSYQLRLQQVKFEFTETELFPVQVELWVSWGETPETNLILTAKVSLP